jgi:N-acetylgalactosamine 4-sulfate 6-O-sulfotransferase
MARLRRLRRKCLLALFIVVIVVVWYNIILSVDIIHGGEASSTWFQTGQIFTKNSKSDIFLWNHSTLSPPLPGMASHSSRDADKLNLLNSFIDTFRSLFPQSKRLPGFKNPCWNVHIHAEGTSDAHTVSKMLPSLSEKIKVARGNTTCLPYFFLLGYPKCGTTTLYKLLKIHQDFASASVKEPAWWGPSRVSMDKPIPFISDYVHMFELASADILQSPHSAITADCSTSNSFMIPFGNNVSTTFIDAIPYMFSMLFPDAKFIVIMKDPVDRMCSQFYFEGPNRCPKNFLQHLKKNTLNETVHAHINAYKVCMKNMRDEHLCAYHYYQWVNPVHECLLFQLHISMYYHSLYHWLHYFPRKQFLFLQTEELVKSPMYMAIKMYKFLNMSELDAEGWKRLKYAKELQMNENIVFHRHLKRCRDDAMSADTAQVLTEFYEPFNKKLKDLLPDVHFIWSK